jgi:hypothetical protein
VAAVVWEGFRDPSALIERRYKIFAEVTIMETTHPSSIRVTKKRGADTHLRRVNSL